MLVLFQVHVDFSLMCKAVEYEKDTLRGQRETLRKNKDKLFQDRKKIDHQKRELGKREREIEQESKKMRVGARDREKELDIEGKWIR